MRAVIMSNPAIGTRYIMTDVIDAAVEPYEATLLKLATSRGKDYGLFESADGKFRAEVLMKKGDE